MNTVSLYFNGQPKLVLVSQSLDFQEKEKGFLYYYYLLPAIRRKSICDDVARGALCDSFIFIYI